MVEIYLSILKSYHYDWNFSIYAFLSSCIHCILSGIRLLFLHIKKDRLLITKEILEKIILVMPILIEDLNINSAFKVVWASFLQRGEFTNISTKTQAQIFVNTKLT